MLEVLQFYVSGFWVWVGLTWGLVIVVHGVTLVIAALLGRKG